MKMLSFLILLFICASCFAQQVPVSTVPSWVKAISFSKEVADTMDTSGGIYDLVSDEQWNLLTKETFHHFAQKILTEKGLENNASISQSYDPAYETLIFHSILVHREGRIINALKGGKFEVLRREENLERLIYDGSLTAVFNVHDLRVGDVLEYSYTVKGWNPAFGNKFSSSIYLNYSVPVGLVFIRLVTEENRPLNISNINSVPSPEISTDEGKKNYEWKLEKVPAILFEDGTPGWFEPYNRIDLSDFKSWQEITAWAHSLFLPSFVTNKALDEKIDGLKKNQDKEEAINKCIRFVQDEVRYLSFSDGIHGFKPHAASKVFDQRYGDCKDKSVLLSYMLTRMGIQSYPVLVHSRKGRVLSKVAPSPIRFNHCIVSFNYNDSIYWVDPTFNLQRGALKDRYTPDYKYGLVIKEGGKDLSGIPDYMGESKINVEEIFDVATVGTSATLKVISTYFGDEANSIRDRFRESNLSSVSKNYLNFYASDYPEIKSLKQVIINDNEKENIFKTEEEYLIDPFWKYDTTQAQYSLEIYPRGVTTYLLKPNTKIRSMPFSLTYPQDVSYRVTLNMPEKWNVTYDSKTIESPGFVFNRVFSLADNQTSIHLNYFFKAKKPFLEASEAKEHSQKINDTYDHLSFDISYTKSINESGHKFGKPYILIGIVLLALLVFGLRRLNHYDPEPQPAEEYYAQIGGWLILTGIGLIVSPISFAVTLSDSSFVYISNWSTLLTSPNLLQLFYELYEFVIDIVIMCYSVFLCSIFITRRTSFPKLMLIFLIANVANHLIGLSFSFFLEVPDLVKENGRLLLSAVFGASIWVPYFIVSKRVKGTFVHRA